MLYHGDAVNILLANRETNYSSHEGDDSLRGSQELDVIMQPGQNGAFAIEIRGCEGMSAGEHMVIFNVARSYDDWGKSSPVLRQS